MKNSELRSLTTEKMKGKLGKSIAYTLLYFLIVGLLMYTPAGLILGIPLGLGFVKMLALYEEGHTVKAFDFFSHGIDNFGNAWCTYLLMCLKCLAPMIITIVGLVLIILSETIMNYIIIGNALTIIGLVWNIYILLKYSLINYEIIYNPNLKARELMKKCTKDTKGNMWKIACMYLYYYLIIIVSTVLFAVIINIISTLIKSILLEILLIFIVVIISYAVIILIQPQMIVALNELYKDITGEKMEEKSNI